MPRDLLPDQSARACSGCGGARVEVILGSVIPCGRCGGVGTEPSREVVDLLEKIVALRDPADWTRPDSRITQATRLAQDAVTTYRRRYDASAASDETRLGQEANDA